MNDITILWGTDEITEVNYSFESEEALASFKLGLAESAANGAVYTIGEVDEALQAEIDEAIADAGLTIVEDDEPQTETATEEVAV